MRNNKGFTLVELMVVITLIAFVVAISVNYTNYDDRAARNNASKLIADFTTVEGNVGVYQAEKGIYPTGLTDASFVPSYLFVPIPPTSWDVSYGTSGYFLAQRTGQAAPNNGYYVCAKTTITGATDTNWLAMGYVAEKLSSNKFFYNTSCPATVNMGAPGGAVTLYATYWITRN